MVRSKRFLVTAATAVAIVPAHAVIVTFNINTSRAALFVVETLAPHMRLKLVRRSPYSPTLRRCLYLQGHARLRKLPPAPGQLDGASLRNRHWSARRRSLPQRDHTEWQSI